MIDKETAIEWAKVAGLKQDDWHNGYFSGWSIDIQRLVNIAYNQGAASVKKNQIEESILYKQAGMK